MLRRGSRVAIIAPASPIVPERLSEGLDVVREAGLVPVLGPCVRGLKSDKLYAASLQDRVAEINWAFKDPSISGIICAVGGLGSAGVLPYLDYEMIRKSRKPLLGRSDISALNSGLLSQAGLISINGQTPSIRVDKGQTVIKEECDSLLKTLYLMMSDKPWEDQPFLNNPFIPRTVSPGRARGHVIGCNIDTYSRLLGTPFVSNANGAILFVEDIHKSGEGIAREFLHLKLAGVLDSVAGVVIGEFQDCGKDSTGRIPTIESAIQEFFSDGPPCVFGYPFSHGSIVAPIPYGAECEMNADTGEISFNFSMSK